MLAHPLNPNPRSNRGWCAVHSPERPSLQVPIPTVSPRRCYIAWHRWRHGLGTVRCRLRGFRVGFGLLRSRCPPPPSLSTSSVGLLAGVQGRGRRGAGVGSELRKKGSIAVWALFSVPYCLYLVIIVQSWTN